MRLNNFKQVFINLNFKAQFLPNSKIIKYQTDYIILPSNKSYLKWLKANVIYDKNIINVLTPKSYPTIISYDIGEKTYINGVAYYLNLKIDNRVFMSLSDYKPLYLDIKIDPNSNISDFNLLKNTKNYYL